MKRSSLLPLVLLSCPLFATGKDPADYPLKAQILRQNWHWRDAHRGIYEATGIGNVVEGGEIHAFNYTYVCSVDITPTVGSQAYSAKWKKPQLRLAILGSRIGKTDKYDECEMQTTVRDGVYVVASGGVISELSQASYKELLARRRASRSSAASASVVSKLSITSAPDGAEIDIDGEFMGNTPSVLELAPGEHAVTIKKAGYKTWEKKIKLVAGEVKLNAELEQDK